MKVGLSGKRSYSKPHGKSRIKDFMHEFGGCMGVER